MQFKKDDHVVYGNFGVCKVNGLRFMSFCADKPKENYYILSPLSNRASTYYVPVKNSGSDLRSPLSEEEIHTMLDKARSIPYAWTENRQSRYDNFNLILSKGVSAELIALLHCLYQRRSSLSDRKKSLSSTDEAIFSNAEKLIHEEFAFSLGINKNEVSGFITKYFNNSP